MSEINIDTSSFDQANAMGAKATVPTLVTIRADLRMPRRINIFDRRVSDIAIPIQVLWIRRIGRDGVRLDESSHERIIPARLIKIQLVGVGLLPLAGEAIRRRRRPVRVARLAVGVVAQLRLSHAIAVRGYSRRAEMIAQQTVQSGVIIHRHPRSSSIVIAFGPACRPLIVVADVDRRDPARRLADPVAIAVVLEHADDRAVLPAFEAVS